MTVLGELLAARIEREGPLPFRDFMWTALYHPGHGYYRRARDPFGKDGDFFTAEQLQPVFGILIAQRVRELARAMGDPPDFTVVELGAGRGEMSGAFADWPYIAVDIDRAEMPPRFRGVVFSNEFFDALPVETVLYEHGKFCDLRVTFANGRFEWARGEVVTGETERYLRDFYPPPQEGRRYEISPLALWTSKIASSLAEGWVLTIDYGFTREESVRFPAGTLMSYRRHLAMEDVLANPGERDITAHVNFTAMMQIGERCGLVTESFETLARALLRAGETDEFAAALGSGNDELRRRMQLKSLLFGMGETFRVLLQRRDSNRTTLS
jgi:SAM-dependent MidA family methyltransferase